MAKMSSFEQEAADRTEERKRRMLHKQMEAEMRKDTASADDVDLDKKKAADEERRDALPSVFRSAADLLTGRRDKMERRAKKALRGD